MTLVQSETNQHSDRIQHKTFKRHDKQHRSAPQTMSKRTTKHAQTAPKTAYNAQHSKVTISNTETHHKPFGTTPQDTLKQRLKQHTKPRTERKTQTERQSFQRKKIFDTHTNRPRP